MSGVWDDGKCPTPLQGSKDGQVALFTGPQKWRRGSLLRNPLHSLDSGGAQRYAEKCSRSSITYRSAYARVHKG
jgi:hypothetical protein